MASRAFSSLAVAGVLSCVAGGRALAQESDDVFILDDFFIEGTAIPAPGPFTCGPDPTRDELSCPASSCG